MSWPSRRLADLCEVITKGTTPTTLGFDFSDAGIRFLRVQNIEGGTVKYDSDTLFIDERAHQALRRSQIRPGDVLISIAGTIGRSAVVPENSPALNCNQAVAIVRTHGSVFRPFLRHWLESSDAQRQMRGAAVTGTISNLSLAQVGNLHVPSPSLTEQRRIADVLDRADALRAKRRAALVQLDGLTHALFLDLFGDLRSERGRWPMAPLEKLVRETKLGLVRGAHEFGPDYLFPYVRMNAITRNGQLELGAVQRTHATQTEVEAYRLEPGDLLFNTRNSEELVGKTALFRGGGLHLFNNNVMRIRFTVDADPEFIAAAFQTPVIQHELSLRKSGTTSVFAIYYKDLRSLPLPVPPLDLQHEFARRVTAVEKLKTVHRASRTQLDALFVSLQHRAFRGEL